MKNASSHKIRDFMKILINLVSYILMNILLFAACQTPAHNNSNIIYTSYLHSSLRVILNQDYLLKLLM